MLQKHFSMHTNYFHLHPISSPLSITSVLYYLLSKQNPVLHESIQSGCFKYSYVSILAHILQHLPQILISGFHRALLQSITFISRLNALDYTKLKS